MKKIVSLLLALTLVLGCFAVSTAEAAFTPGTYTATGAGYAGPGSVTVTVTVDEEKITAIEIAGDLEQPFGVPAFPAMQEALTGKNTAEFDAIAGATMTSNGVMEAVGKALAEARGEAADASAPLAFTAGEYEASGAG